MTVSTAVSKYFGSGLRTIAPSCTLTLSSLFSNCTSTLGPSTLTDDIDSSDDEGEQEHQVDGNGDGDSDTDLGIGGQSTALPRLINQRSPSQLQFSVENLVAFSQQCQKAAIEEVDIDKDFGDGFVDISAEDSDLLGSPSPSACKPSNPRHKGLRVSDRTSPSLSEARAKLSQSLRKGRKSHHYPTGKSPATMAKTTNSNDDGSQSSTKSGGSGGNTDDEHSSNPGSPTGDQGVLAKTSVPRKKNPTGASGQKMTQVQKQIAAVLFVPDAKDVMEATNLPPEIAKLRDNLVVKLKRSVEADKKLGQKQRLGKIADQRQLVARAKVELAILGGVQDQLVKVSEINAQLVKKVATLEKDLETARKSKKAMKLKISEEHCAEITNYCKDHLWRGTKFITSDSDYEKAASRVLKGLGLNYDEEMAASWKITYNKIIKKAIASARNYLTQELKKVAWALMEKGIPLPTAKDLLKCALRQIDLNNPVEVKLMIWYWKDVLSKALGANDWGKGNCNYVCILLAKDSYGRFLCTIAHEAMLVVNWENNEDKWASQYQEKAKNPNTKLASTGGKFTTTESGQTEYTAWSDDGLDQYNKYRKAIKKRRTENKDEMLEVEKKILAVIRKDLGLVCSDPEAERKKKKMEKRKRKENKPIPAHKTRRIVSTVDSDDEE